ncbi:Tail fiber assembly protein U' [Thelohanellus kitauei]|uniref:Tail fiber assembly protein U n=1 Tax=Thelohanellus kitauei TaxID=669202 RepID=A0A0C2MN77_THEKT|nr:Tail fiber assembly protein U' [Thelohanellus kitauei]
MITMKNFTVENVDLNGLLIAVATDETGADWYESQKNFHPDTLKVVFDAVGLIISEGQDVSALWPGGNSIAEVDPADVPAEFTLNGEWVFDGKQIKPRTYDAGAESKRKDLLSEAATVTADWRVELQLNTISEEDKASLIKWMEYIKAVKATELSQVKDEDTFNQIEWPDKPEG